MAGRGHRRGIKPRSAQPRGTREDALVCAAHAGLAMLLGPTRKKMPRDPRRLKASELLQLLNSTPLGTVLSERKLFSQRMAAGLRIAPPQSKDNRRIDLLRYAAWLCAERHAETKIQAFNESLNRGAGDAGDYEAHKEAARARQAQASKTGRDIGAPPPVINLARREEGARSLQRFAEIYFAVRFTLAWSDDHIRFWNDLERTIVSGPGVEGGGQLAESMPRGTGKTSMIEVASIWAVVRGHRRYVVPIGPTKPDAVKLLRSIKVELETNDLLLADYPEICFPIRALGGIVNRARGQLCEGRRTCIEWARELIVLPTMPDSKASGSIIETRGITGALRGMKHTLQDGTTIRPDLVLVDDPQTKRSAKSPGQCETRESILHGDVLGLAGPNQKIACLVTCTVIVKGDVADRLLDRNIRPQWQGVRVPMVRAFPTAEKLWDEYADLRRDGLRTGDRGKPPHATKFYRKHRVEMDRGAEVYWPARFDADELSAIQHAMNLKIDDEATFWAEYQNAPQDPHEQGGDRLTIAALEIKVGGVARKIVPLACQKLVAFIDVQQKVLWYLVAGFGEHFSGSVVDWGAWPDQGRDYFGLADARRTFAREFPGAQFESQIYQALGALTGELMQAHWKNEAGTAIPIERILIDANWGKSTDIVHQFCRESPHHGIVMPSQGRGIGASQCPLNEYKRKTGDKIGHYWRIPGGASRATKYLVWDVNYWKSFCSQRLRAALADKGSISFCKMARHGANVGGGVQAGQRMLLEQLCAEYPVPVEGRGRLVDEWKLIPGRDNHLWDALVGCCVAASEKGVATVGHSAIPQRKVIKLSEVRSRRL